jgi:hypothetical protein
MDLRVALLIVAGGCYDPTPTDGAPCSEHKECPAELMCAFGKCVREAPPCVEIENGAGKLKIPRLDEPIVLDGNLADWPTCFIDVDLSSAGLVRDLNGGGKYAPGRFSIAAAEDRIYVAAEVQGSPPLGDHALPDVYLNNAISVYFDGDGNFPSRTYGTDAAQIVVDHANRMQAFRGGAITPASVEHAATVDGSTFVIEMAVTPTTFGLTAFGSSVGFDIGLVGGDGMLMTSELVWFQACKPPACVCTNGLSAPYCDARQFGTATFQ